MRRLSLFIVVTFAAAISANAQWLPANATDTAAVTHSGDVGIGATSAPLNKLHVLGSRAADGISLDGANNPAFVLRGGTNGSNNPQGNAVRGYAPAIATSSGAYFTNASGGDIVFRTEAAKLLFGRGSGASTLAVVGASVGIGNSAPTATLDVTGTAHVSGDMTVDGNIAAKFQDVAEWVPATTPMKPGTVVILNPNHANEVMPSHTAYDTTVAGVVSAQPGVTLGIPADSKAKVATTGRVKVFVDATKSPVAIGDLLVTSDEEGTAMKSLPIDLGGVKIHRPGTVIGKALEPLQNGKGEILVLLSLQ